MNHPDSDPQSPAIEYGRPDSTYVDRPPAPSTGRKVAGWLLGIVAVILVAALFTPVLNKARDGDSNEGKCRWNMHQIGLGVYLYVNDFNGAYPDDLSQLLANEKMTPGVFVCPSSNDTPATQPSDLLAGGHCSYVYLGRGLTEKTVKATDVIAYDPPGNHAVGCHILFGDAHVETVETARAARLIAAAEAAMTVRVRSATAKPR